MKKLKTTLAALIAGAAFASGAMADEKKEAAAPHTDYFSVGATVSGIAGTDLRSGETIWGFKLTRRVPIKENRGLQLSLAAAPRFANIGLDLSVDNLSRNVEIYAGGGVAIYNKPEFSLLLPRMGIKYHLLESHGLFLAGEVGTLLGLDRAGAYGTLEFGVRFDVSSTVKKK